MRSRTMSFIVTSVMFLGGLTLGPLVHSWNAFAFFLVVFGGAGVLGTGIMDVLGIWDD